MGVPNGYTSAQVVQAVPTGINSALVYIGGGALTAAAAETEFTNVFSSTYRNYLIVWNNVYSTSSTVNFGLQLGSVTSGYEFGVFQIESTTASWWAGSASTSYMRLGNANNAASSQANAGSCWVFDPQTTNTNKRFHLHSSSYNDRCYIGYGGLSSSTQFTSIKFFVAANSFAAGDVKFYGLVNS